MLIFFNLSYRSTTDEQLIQYFASAQGHTKEFQQFFGVDYSYAMIRTVLEERGFIDGWHKPIDKKTEEKEVCQITIQRQKNNSSMNLTMTAECKERYKQFTDENGDGEPEQVPQADFPAKEDVEAPFF